MRLTKKNQLKLGEIPISEIQFDLKSRDDIPQLLMGLQHLYVTDESREKVFSILEKHINPDVSKTNGRPGMELWTILVMGVLRLNLNWDYDRLHEMVNNHRKIREMLGIGPMNSDLQFNLQTIKDNVSLITVDVLDKINQVVIEAGHTLVKKKDDEKLKGRCDSFVVETDVHYPTDINLLFDAIRKVITLVAALCATLNLSEWRQSKHNLKKVKKIFRTAQKLKRSTSKDEKKKKVREKAIKEAHQIYIETVEGFLAKARATIEKINTGGLFTIVAIFEIENYIQHAERQIDQIRRRVIDGEVIPHNEKVFSIFETHTEWISKGKAGVPVELGQRVCILEDQYGFILHHLVMNKITDDKVAISMVQEAQKRFPCLSSCSFDKGFYTPSNLEQLRALLDFVVLPKKGRLSFEDKKREHSEDFISARYQHSAVESAINALEVHGLDRCLDHGSQGFRRYVALGVLARNIQKVGAILLKKEQKAQQQKERYKMAA